MPQAAKNVNSRSAHEVAGVLRQSPQQMGAQVPIVLCEVQVCALQRSGNACNLPAKQAAHSAMSMAEAAGA